MQRVQTDDIEPKTSTEGFEHVSVIIRRMMANLVEHGDMLYPCADEDSHGK